MNLNNKMMEEVCAEFKIQHHNLMPYRPKMNGAVKMADKNLKKIIEKTTDNYKDWHKKTSIYIECLSYYGANIYWSYFILIGLWYGSCPTNKGGDTIIVSIDGNQIRWGWMGSGQVWTAEYDKKSDYQPCAMANCIRKEWCKPITRKFNLDSSKKVIWCWNEFCL